MEPIGVYRLKLKWSQNSMNALKEQWNMNQRIDMMVTQRSRLPSLLLSSFTQMQSVF